MKTRANMLMWAALFLAALASCDKPKPVTVQNIFNNPTIREIYTLQDARKADSLLRFFNATDTLVLKAVSLAFASAQDSIGIDPLVKLLSHPASSVRKASAYALGQIGNVSAESRLTEATDKEQNPEVKAVMLEAHGKCSTKEGEEHIALTSDTSSVVILGAAKGLYRAALKGNISPKGTADMVRWLSHPSSDVRLMASNYFSRFRKTTFPEYISAISEAIKNDPNPLVRLNCARGLSNTPSSESVNALLYALEHDKEYTVRVAAIQSLQLFEGETVKQALFTALHDSSEHVAQAAAQYFVEGINRQHVEDVLSEASKATSWKIKSTLYTAAAPFDALKRIPGYVREAALKASNPYELAAYIGVLGNYPGEYVFLANIIGGNEHPVVKGAAMEGLIKIRANEKYAELKKEFPELDARLANAFKQAMLSKDVALVFYAADVLRNPDYKYKEYFKDNSFLLQARDSLPLPLDIEAYIEVQKTIDAWEGKTTPTSIPKFTGSPINWDEVLAIPVGKQIEVVTNKGTFVMELFVNDAPGTVSTILRLVRQGFYNGKTFHRVVSNFVVQGGCPRGDGFGGLPYTIRSEFAPLSYSTGMVGVASAGKDTESCQWFVTHVPTPHLDGRYTIFARVVSGMDVVHKLQIGDVMQKVVEVASTTEKM